MPRGTVWPTWPIRRPSALQIPYEDTTLPGYFFWPAGVDGRHAADADLQQWQRRGGERRLAAGHRRCPGAGLNTPAFDGPGQNAALVRRQLPFRPDWEKVITPVVDYLLTRPDVDPGKVALVGVSQAGYWVPRSVAFEHRIAAAVADPGVIDISTTMTAQVPHFLLKMMEAGEKDKFDKDVG